MHMGSDGIIYYSSEDGKELKGVTMVCAAAHYGKCDGKECGGFHSKPHTWDDMECFAECCHAGKDGLCIIAPHKKEANPLW
jgi:hypothetical protein